MTLTFETLGNATIQFAVDGKPVLATDPWLVGTCYFGSWALDHALTDPQIRAVRESDYLWISHGHPDHLHADSLKLLPRGKTVLLPDHYHLEIHDFLLGEGFKVEILQYRRWRQLHPKLSVLCIDNENQDAILVARFGDALVINLNDSPYSGEMPFLRKLVRQHDNHKIYVLQLCSVDADMKNFVDAQGQRTIEAPEVLKPGAVETVARAAWRLGARHFCCSSSQHLYVRRDSLWANPYRITFADMQRYWNRPNVRLVPPFVTMDVERAEYLVNYPADRPDTSQITDRTGEDDWNEPLSPLEWDQVGAFFKRFKLLGRFIDFVEISVAGERRRFPTRARWALLHRREDGVTFFVPRRSLIETVTYGYFDDLLIGNFMKTQLHGHAELYPNVTPVIAKIGGNAKVYTARQYLRFCWRYFRRNPAVFLRHRLESAYIFSLQPFVRRSARKFGVFDILKRYYHVHVLGDRRSMGADGPVGGTGTELVSAESHEAVAPRIATKSEPRPRIKLAPCRPDFSIYEHPKLIVSIDAEEDFDWSAAFSSQSAAVQSMSRQDAAQEILEGHKLVPIYLCDYPVATQEPSYRVLREWQRDGRCAIGSQLHPWVNPPHIEKLDYRNSYVCNLPLALQQEKLRILTEAITENIGVRPVVYKAGRYGGDLSLPALLKPFGYSIDMSINPIRNYRSQGGPDHTRFPHAPFWYDAERELLAIPLTCDVLGLLRGNWLELADVIWSKTAERLRLGAVLRYLNLINKVTLTPEGVPLSEAKALTRFLVARGHRVFSLSYHSTSLNPGSNPYVRDGADLRKFLSWLDAYLDFFLGELQGTPVLPFALYEDARRIAVTTEVLP